MVLTRDIAEEIRNSVNSAINKSLKDQALIKSIADKVSEAIVKTVNEKLSEIAERMAEIETRQAELKQTYEEGCKESKGKIEYISKDKGT
ncbi:hypothetical protein JTB14_012135 [Gonioctena quinquepunctata]|nr:hypothetical protein JTB14_012135 [Gonioctena quinquepunctata]